MIIAAHIKIGLINETIKGSHLDKVSATGAEFSRAAAGLKCRHGESEL